MYLGKSRIHPFLIFSSTARQPKYIEVAPWNQLEFGLQERHPGSGYLQLHSWASEMKEHTARSTDSVTHNPHSFSLSVVPQPHGFCEAGCWWDHGPSALTCPPLTYGLSLCGFWGQGLPILPHGPAQDELRESWRRSFHVAGEAAAGLGCGFSIFFKKRESN